VSTTKRLAAGVRFEKSSLLSGGPFEIDMKRLAVLGSAPFLHGPRPARRLASNAFWVSLCVLPIVVVRLIAMT
jgi:hypothetical protein